MAAMLAVGTSAVAVTSVSAEENAPVAYSESEEKTWGDYKYTVLDDGTVEITRYTGSDTDIVIPNEIDGKNVTSIGVGAFLSCTGLKSIEIPDSVVSIGVHAFESCTSLESITIPQSVDRIQSWSFRFCDSLKNVIIKNGVISIDNYAFYGCTLLESVKIPNSVTHIWSEAFYSCPSLKSVTIPSSVTEIDQCAFGYYGNYSIDGMPFVDRMSDFTIYSTKGTTAEKYANENLFKFVDINERKSTLLSSVGNIAVKGAFDNGTTLNVEETTVENAIVAYNITLNNENGETIQPSGEITVSIPSDKANCKVYLIQDGGTKVDMNAVYTDGKYEFTTDHLSVYALVEDTDEPSTEPSAEPSEKPSTEPSNNSTNNNTTTSETGKTAETGKNAVNTGDSSNAMAIASMFLAGIITSVVMIFKKKRT